jgi:type IV fimbrial biogenesis protein FimT
MALRARSSGFSLVELMVALTILIVISAVALPSYQSWLVNSRIRNAASSITMGLQRARTEAVTRNTSVSFTLAADSSWSVDVVAPASQIESRLAGDGSDTVIVSPAGPTTITFGSLGIVSGGADRQFDVTSSTGGKTLRVTVGASGNARMCDPSGHGVSAC